MTRIPDSRGSPNRRDLSPRHAATVVIPVLRAVTTTALSSVTVCSNRRSAAALSRPGARPSFSRRCRLRGSGRAGFPVRIPARRRVGLGPTPSAVSVPRSSLPGVAVSPDGGGHAHEMRGRVDYYAGICSRRKSQSELESWTGRRGLLSGAPAGVRRTVTRRRPGGRDKCSPLRKRLEPPLPA